MAFRSDISVDWSTSPRIITVAAPSTELSIQDLVDTCRELEQQSHNLAYASLINAAGKESLGGGVLVGITAELLNAVVAFEGRTGSDSSGTVTTADTTGTLLIDNTATFISDGILAGDTIFNTTDGSVTSVISVNSETEIRHYPLADGTDNDWDISDNYKIWNKIQCNITGGNLVAVNDADLEISPVLPTSQTHIVRTASSSATLQEQEDVQYSSFNGYVTVNQTTGSTGTRFPKGTGRDPVNNIADAKLIAAERGFSTIYFVGDYTFTAGDNVSLYELVGQSINSTTLNFPAGVITAGTEFRNCTIDGTLISPRFFDNCEFLNVIGDTIGGIGTMFIKDCGFLDTITLSSAVEGEMHLIGCFSGIPGTTTPIFDINGADVNILTRNWSGGMNIRNFSNVNNPTMSLDFDSGQVIIENTCTTGTITLRGSGTWTNSATYAGTTTINDNFINQPNVASAVWDDSVSDHQSSGSFGEYVSIIISKLNALIGLS